MATRTRVRVTTAQTPDGRLLVAVELTPRPPRKVRRPVLTVGTEIVRRVG